jgi:hypothetical protein
MHGAGRVARGCRTFAAQRRQSSSRGIRSDLRWSSSPLCRGVAASRSNGREVQIDLTKPRGVCPCVARSVRRKSRAVGPGSARRDRGATRNRIKQIRRLAPPTMRGRRGSPGDCGRGYVRPEAAPSSRGDSCPLGWRGDWSKVAILESACGQAKRASQRGEVGSGRGYCAQWEAAGCVCNDAKPSRLD